MDYIQPENDLEIMVSNEAIITLRKRIRNLKVTEEFLKTKKFHFGDIVQKSDTRVFDKVFGCGGGSIGKIVGWDMTYNNYRVYYSDYNPYIGVKEEELELYTGEVPRPLMNHDPYSFKGLGY